MRPLSGHWADVVAAKVRFKNPKSVYTVASGITPSGLVHVGNFREVITVDFVARALMDLGCSVRFLYSWDNFDTLRKVPPHVPNPQEYKVYLREAISRIPDPWSDSPSYAKGRMDLFEKELKEVGILPEYLDQEKRYKEGVYGEAIILALEKRHEIREILNKYRTEPLGEDWLPVTSYCGKCRKDQMVEESYEGEGQYRYVCGCGWKETVDVRSYPNIKLVWRVDWPMRWHHEKVDFEPGGKDHSSQGGSYDTAKEIVKKIWDFPPPEYLQYDFVMMKGLNGKMSSSKGELFTITDVLNVYEPQILRWIFANQRPNHDFSFSFDEDVFKIYDEFDRFESKVFQNPDKNSLQFRIYNLSQVERGPLPEVPPARVGFRSLCNHLQILGGDILGTWEKFYSHLGDANKTEFLSRAKRAWFWIKNHSPQEFRYTLREEPLPIPAMGSKAYELHKACQTLVRKEDFSQMGAEEIKTWIWEHWIQDLDLKPAEVFSHVYDRLIDRKQGPRLPQFMKEISQDILIKLL